MKIKLITEEQYKKLCGEYSFEAKSRNFNKEEIYEYSVIVFDNNDEEAQIMEKYLKSLGVTDIISRFACDISY